MGKKSTTKSKSTTVYGNTTTTNPYVTSTTNNNGTTSYFNKGTSFDTINNFVNSNMNNLLNEYLNPSLNSTTNKAKLDSFTNTLNAESSKNLENNIINPLSRRNMVRSSQATNMYNNLAKITNSSIAEYANDLLANSQNNSASMLSNLIALYMNGYDVLSNAQSQSLATSQGNATRSQTVTQKTSSDWEKIASVAAQAAFSALNPTGAAVGAAANASKSGTVKKAISAALSTL